MIILKKKAMYFIFLSILITQIVISKAGRAEIFNVSNEAELRQALFAAANNGENDAINVATGTYKTGGTPFSYEAVASENFSISLIGAGAGLTTLDGENLDRVLIIDTNSLTNDSDTEITIKSLTIQNGNSTRASGGLNIISKSASVNLENCEIQNNNATYSGGGASIIGKSAMIMNCEFTNNATASLGGGIFIHADTVTVNGDTVMNNTAAGPGGGINIINAETATLSNNRFENNASTASDGGAASIHADNVSLPQNNSFSGNSAQNNGGAVFITEAFNATLANNLFENNSADQNGGGVHISASSQVIMNHNTFNSNRCRLDGGGALVNSDATANLNANSFTANISNRNGGGAYVDSNNGILTNNIFVKNGSINSGGAAYMVGAVSNTINNTMTLNSTAGNGGGLSVDLHNETDTANIYNNIIFNNTSQTSGQDDIFVDDDKRFSQLGSFVKSFNNDFTQFLSSCEHSAGCAARINRGNNISADPQFVDSQAGDVHLMENSPAIDAGSEIAPDLPPADFDGNPRIQGPAPDLGALESAGPPPPPHVLIEKTPT